MKKNIKRFDDKHLIIKNWYMMIPVIVIATYTGPVALSKYNGEIFLYEHIVSNFSDICALLTIFTTLWICKPIYNKKDKPDIDKSYMQSKIYCVILLVIIPILAIYGYFLYVAYTQFGVGSLGLIIPRLIGFLVSLLAITYIVCILALKMATWWESILYTLLVFATPFLVFGAVEIFFIVFVPGFPISFENEVLGLFSPISTLSYINHSSEYKYSLEFFISYWFAIVILMNKSISKVSKKRIEKLANNNFANSKISQFLTIVITSSVLLLLNLIQFLRFSRVGTGFELKHLFLPVLGTIITFVILASLQNRRLMKFRDNIINLGVICVITGIIFSITYFTKGFGMSNSVPNADDISHITAVTVLPRDYDALSSWDIYPYVRISEKDSISKAISFHENMIRDITISDETLPNTNKEPFFLNLTYYMKDGEKIARSYYLSEAQYSQLKELQYTQDILVQSEPLFQNKVKNIRVYDDVFTKGMSLDNHVDAIANAYSEDLKAITSENSKSEDNIVRYHIIYSMDTVLYIDEYGNYQEKNDDFDYVYQIIVDDRHKNTLAYIRNLDEETYPVSFEYSLIDKSVDPDKLVTDGRVKRSQDLHYKLSDFITYEKESGEIEQYSDRLLNIYDKNTSHDKLFIEGIDNDLRIKTLIPILD